MTNAADSKFQVQVAYTELRSDETGQLANFYSVLQKAMIHSMKLTVAMIKVGTSTSNPAPVSAPTMAASQVNANAQSEVFASVVNPAQPAPAQAQ